MTSLTNDADRLSARQPTRADDLDEKIFAHWDSAVHRNLGDTVPMQIIS